MEQQKSLEERGIWEHPPEPGTDRNEAKSQKFLMVIQRLNPWWWGGEKWLLDDHRRIHSSSSRCIKSHTVHAERRNISYSNEAHRRYQNNKNLTGRNDWKTDWRSLERGWRERIVRCMDRLHKIHLIERKATGRIYMVRGRDLRGSKKTSRPDDVWPDMWKCMSDAAKKKAKQKCAVEKPKRDNARQLRGIYFVEPDDEEFKLIIKAARRKLEVRMPAAMPCKIPRRSIGETAMLGNAGQDLLVLLMPTRAPDQG